MNSVEFRPSADYLAKIDQHGWTIPRLIDLVARMYKTVGRSMSDNARNTLIVNLLQLFKAFEVETCELIDVQSNIARLTAHS